MESDILVEGFSKSVSLHGLKYTKFIGDGDSNVYKKILDCRPYSDVTVEKIECKNHLLRNMCNKLKEIVRNSKCGPVSLRKLIGNRIMRLRIAVCMAVRHRKKEDGKSQQEKIADVRQDLLNAPYHVFGQHSKCAKYFCKSTKKETNFVPPLIEAGLFNKIMEIMNKFADHSKSLLYDISSNNVEEFNSIIAKFIGGKRINYCLKKSYQARCNAAVVSHNTRMPFYSLHKSLFLRSPGIYCKLSEQRRDLRRQRSAIRRKDFRPKRLFNNKIINDKSYGQNAEKPDIEPELYASKRETFLLNLKISNEEKLEIMKKTTLQNACPVWREERRKRLTASNFGVICNKLPHTKCDTIVKKILYSNFDNASLRYGRIHEKDAIDHLKSIDVNVNECGLIIDEELPFLAATPDGLIGDDGIVEIKCPSSASDLTPEEAIIQRKVKFWLINKQTNEINLNKKHIYFYQVQGQLHISKRNYCIFVLWTPKGIKIEKIERDDAFWDNNMKEKLIKFYYDCLLPELIDPRYPRSLPIRNPDYIIEAEKLRASKLKTK